MENKNIPQPKYVIYEDEDTDNLVDHDIFSCDIVPQEILAQEHKNEPGWLLRRLWRINVKIFKQNNRAYGCKKADINWTMRLQSWQYLLALAKILRARNLYNKTTKIWNLKDGREFYVEE